jgi:thioester reductase-like protein
MTDGLPQPSARTLLSNQRLSNRHQGLTVVLTGATGFIGRHLSSHLIQDPRVAQVHCLAIRLDASRKPRHLAIESEKIIEYASDLSNLSLGLSDSQLIFLADHAHAIIHNGADVSLLKTYPSLRRANSVSWPSRAACPCTTYLPRPWPRS